ncbi:class I SAM-dependent methyltransferase [Bradyrhizobium sp. U87765 SZCCT0131]|uniref:methyltransferase regulatory domain-containing protein n=1 Tax=unclassified Bradyrhizobium TaxID=2631580 RepID=UPI001BA6A5BD|nr:MULTISPECIES: class I SAM-dependent methyltransferase [unclassified Bradyrhizobium]MBR1220447.1 class I SAM-dependent methyltransferase [Bradyrhizobium sp. U87765 SZCCT0131]MBR1263098.1 class I SAM-dependent methyltransferase [Bradyrhizobium sp. U87765 SZCCT0134]MBR1307019.1 class I SAM-dependent methyltransferase [Bradyrhizobium sp. U87765 SZCCT0110]MBR1323093.1 class I SAM-dependent methyltransferase [Bradyrhizobium sp. U87765 SZCCT0109]MBR1345973.1 class I SAM-dependent methyltransferase
MNIAAPMPTLYDEVYYPGHVYEHTHPNLLGTIGTLYGMTPASVDRCRVLELGCGVGGNLLPMAFQYPDSRFVGIDLSGVTIARGQSNVATLGLRNIELLHRDIMDVDDGFGQFDYIIAHGVYSWVPPAVRVKMMEIFKRNLAPQGICYVSYNAHPYSHLRDMTRDMMLYHTRGITDMKRKTEQARAIMKFLSEGSKADSVHGAVMRDHYNRVRRMPEEVLFHDDLNEIATAFLLHQVVDEAGRHGLQYLSDADFSRRHLAGYSDEVRSTLQRFPDSEFMARDQYQDFIDGNGFRRTLLCHDGVTLHRRFARDFVTAFHLLSTMSPVIPDASVRDDAPMEFRTHEGTTLTVTQPLLKAAHLHLGRSWPRALAFDELLAGARALRGGSATDADRELLIDAMYVLACSGEVTFLTEPPFVVADVSDHPRASLLARWQAGTGPLVTNLLHQTVRLEDDRTRHFLQLLDGSRTVAQIVTEMTAAFGSTTEIERSENGQPIEPLLLSTSDGVARSLAMVGKLGLLVG